MKDFYPELCGQWISRIPQNYQQFQKQNKVLAFPEHRPRGLHIRDGNLVDQFWTQKYIDYFDNPIFTGLDCKSKNVINMPLGFMRHCTINQNSNYMFEQNNNNQYFGKIFWRGRTKTHNIRPKIIDYFIDQKSKQVDIKHWNIDNKKYAIYKSVSQMPPPPKQEYENYFNGLKNSDFFFGN